MLRMVSYPRRPKSGHITCYLNRTYHLLPTRPFGLVCAPPSLRVAFAEPATGWAYQVGSHDCAAWLVCCPLGFSGGRRLVSNIITGMAFFLFLAGALVYTGILYNALVRLKNDNDRAWANICVWPQQRHDEIPNLVETVKG